MSTAERRARDRDRRERSLLDAALVLFDRDDWQAVTVEAIAERAEYAKGTVYRHFASKDDLYARLAADWNAGTCDALEALDADRPFETVLRDLVAVCWRRMTGDRVQTRLLRHVQRPTSSRGADARARATLDASDARLLGLVRRPDRLGRRRGRDPRRAPRAAAVRRGRPAPRRTGARTARARPERSPKRNGSLPTPSSPSCAAPEAQIASSIASPPLISQLVRLVSRLTTRTTPSSASSA